MKEYQIYFVIKKDNCGYIKTMVVSARNKKEAFAAVEEASRKYYKRHAFYKTTTPPVEMENGVLYDGMLYTRGRGRRLW